MKLPHSTYIFGSIALGLTFLAGEAHAVVIQAETTAYRVNAGDADAKDTNDNYFIGNFNNAGESTAYNFLLPDLGGQEIATTQLETFFQKYNDTVAAGTITSLFVKTSSTATRTNADYIAPTDGFDTTPSGWTEIQLDFIPANSSLSEFDSLTMNSTGQSNLSTFLNNYYDSNPTGGDYLVVGFGMDTNGQTLKNFSFTGIYLTSDGTDTGDLSNLTLTVVPEPSATLLIGASGLLLVLRRRRR